MWFWEKKQDSAKMSTSCQGKLPLSLLSSFEVTIEIGVEGAKSVQEMKVQNTMCLRKEFLGLGDEGPSTEESLRIASVHTANNFSVYSPTIR